MSLSLGAAVKAFLETKGLGVPVFTWLPDRQPMPYLLVHDGIASPADGKAAPHAAGGKARVMTEVQVDVWQKVYDDSGDTRERVFDPQLPELVANYLATGSLQTGTLAGTPSRLYGCKLLSGPMELPQSQQSNVKHHVIQLQVPRALQTARV